MEGWTKKWRLDGTRESWARRRHGANYAGMAFVVLGFALQLVGAIPGCCRGLGIVPSVSPSGSHHS